MYGTIGTMTSGTMKRASNPKPVGPVNPPKKCAKCGFIKPAFSSNHTYDAKGRIEKMWYECRECAVILRPR